MRITLLQTDIIWNDPEANFIRLRPLLAQAAQQKAELVVLPEMFSTGFSFISGQDAARADEQSSQFLSRAAAEFGFTIAASLPDTSGSAAKPKNTLKVFSPRGLLGLYAKTHLFSFAGEDQKYGRGDAALTLDIAGIRTSFFICYDLRFTQFFAALAPQSDLFVVVANWPAPRQMHWETLLRARAIENQLYVCGVNRVGSGGGLQYAGGSRIISPRGEILGIAEEGEQLLSVEIFSEEVVKYRAEFPALADRRPALYQDVLSCPGKGSVK